MDFTIKRIQNARALKKHATDVTDEFLRVGSISESLPPDAVGKVERVLELMWERLMINKVDFAITKSGAHGSSLEIPVLTPNCAPEVVIFTDDSCRALLSAGMNILQ
jgi:hypothetical protein